MTQLANIKHIRESNIELLRIILMLMIIGYHLVVHGAEKYVGAKGSFFVLNEFSGLYLLLKSFLVVGVNSFIFISGYYGVKFKVKPFLNIILQTIFYSIIIHLIIDSLALTHIGLKHYVKALIPLLYGNWWFITAYLALTLLSPLLNSAISVFTRNQFLFVLCGLAFISLFLGQSSGMNPILGANRGYSLINFILIYLAGQYIRKYSLTNKLMKYALGFYLGCALFMFLFTLLSISQLNQIGMRHIFAYNNPLVVVSGIAFFFIFKKIHIKSAFINSISPYVLGVYLVHDHPLTRQYLIGYLFKLSQHSSVFLHILYLTTIIVVIFLVGILIDKVRYFILNPVAEYLTRILYLEKVELLISNNPQ